MQRLSSSFALAIWRWPADLPVVEEIIDPKEVQKAPEDWRLTGAEVSEQLDYEPGRFLHRRLVRRKYVRRGDLEAVPVIAALAPNLQERGIAAPGLLAQIIVSKYCDHIPLYRQEAIFGNRHGVYLPRDVRPYPLKGGHRGCLTPLVPAKALSAPHSCSYCVSVSMQLAIPPLLSTATGGPLTLKRSKYPAFFSIAIAQELGWSITRAEPYLCSQMGSLFKQNPLRLCSGSMKAQHHTQC
jgi:transposase